MTYTLYELILRIDIQQQVQGQYSNGHVGVCGRFPWLTGVATQTLARGGPTPKYARRKSEKDAGTIIL
jgi:hypothetical protein